MTYGVGFLSHSAGFYDEDTGFIATVSKGITMWALVEEAAPMAPAKGKPKGRHLAKYWTVVTLKGLAHGVPGYSRAVARATVIYWLEAIFLDAANLDPDHVIPRWLKVPGIWVQCVGYEAHIPHSAIMAIATPERAPYLARACGEVPNAFPYNRDGFFAAGSARMTSENGRMISSCLPLRTPFTPLQPLCKGDQLMLLPKCLRSPFQTLRTP